MCRDGIWEHDGSGRRYQVFFRSPGLSGKDATWSGDRSFLEYGSREGELASGTRAHAGRGRLETRNNCMLCASIYNDWILSVSINRCLGQHKKQSHAGNLTSVQVFHFQTTNFGSLLLHLPLLEQSPFVSVLLALAIKSMMETHKSSSYDELEPA